MTATTVWLRQLELLLAAPRITIREQPVHELFGDTLWINMKFPFVYAEGRNISDAFRFAEAYWILSGDNSVEGIVPYAPSIKNFSDNGHVFQGAYGPKITEQLQYVVETLQSDPNSRQAVISIWRESPRKSKDIPCTLSLQFLIRDKKIHCIANMRSSDVWLGLPYDMFNFTCVANWIRLCLNQIGFNGHYEIELGTLTINMGSSHLYLRNKEAAENVFELPQSLTTGGPAGSGFPSNIKTVDEFMQYLKERRDYEAGKNS